MAGQVLIEICVESLDLAIAAEAGGADRIELCHDLSCDGVTPDAALMRAARQQLRIPIHVLIRPRSGNFCYSPGELETIQRDIDVAKTIGMNGVVVGILHPSGEVDRERTRTMVQAAHPLSVTFHRAFDQCPDLTIALEKVIETGANRILTSGGKPSVMDGLDKLAGLIQASGERIVIMPGGGIRTPTIETILRTTGAREVHTSLDGSIEGAAGMKHGSGLAAVSFEQRVREFKSAVQNVFP